MDETNLQPAAHEIAQLLDGYLRERVLPHPILGPFIPDAAVYVSGSVAFGTWDEQSPIDLRLVLPDEAHTRISAQLREAGLWKPARDFRLRMIDRERFRPAARIARDLTSR